jgi:N-acetyl-1-D-myo-inositol-2-amino-2-deoxy-alpha-D-glucopyranoside deacetylase
MRAHETQVTVDGDYFALSNEIGQRILGTEYYTRLASPPSARGPAARGPRDSDLFTRADR